jgi:hypothetical protein
MEPLEFPGSPHEGIEESPLTHRLFWPLMLCLTYFCVALLLGTSLS